MRASHERVAAGGRLTMMMSSSVDARIKCAGRQVLELRAIRL